MTPGNMTHSLWQSWRNGDLLTADGLLGLQNYVLRNWRLTDNSTGIIEFDFDTVKCDIRENSTHEICCGKVCGITPGGYPVVADQLKCTVPQVPASSYLFHLTVSVDEPDNNPNNHADSIAKFQLHASAMSDIQRSLKDEKVLNLGVYRWSSGNKIEFIKEERPSFRFLAAFPTSDEWHDWTAPIQKALDYLTRELIRKQSTSLWDFTLLSLLIRLQQDWMDAPIRDLARECLRIERIRLRKPTAPIRINDLDRLLDRPPSQIPVALANCLLAQREDWHKAPEQDLTTTGPNHQGLSIAFKVSLKLEGLQIRTKGSSVPGLIDVDIAGGHRSDTQLREKCLHDKPIYQFGPCNVSPVEVWRIPSLSGDFSIEIWILLKG